MSAKKKAVKAVVIAASDYEQAVEQMAKVLAKRRGFTISKSNAPGVVFRLEAKAALKAIGVKPVRVGGRRE